MTLFSEWLNQKQSSSRVLGWRGSQWGRAWEGGTLCNCCAGSKDKHLGMAQPWDLGEPCAFCLWFWAWVGGKADLPGNSLLRQQAASLTGGELTSHSFFRSERGKLDYSSPSQLISSSSLFHITNGFLQAFKCTMLKHYILHSKPYFAPSLPFFFSIACDPLETSVFGQLKGWLGLKWSRLLLMSKRYNKHKQIGESGTAWVSRPNWEPTFTTAKRSSGEGQVGYDEKVLHQKVVRPWNRHPSAVVIAPSWQSSRSIWTTLWHISDFGVVLCGARSWTPWSLWVPSNLGYSMILPSATDFI